MSQASDLNPDYNYWQSYASLRNSKQQHLIFSADGDLKSWSGNTDLACWKIKVLRIKTKINTHIIYVIRQCMIHPEPIRQHPPPHPPTPLKSGSNSHYLAWVIWFKKAQHVVVAPLLTKWIELIWYWTIRRPSSVVHCLCQLFCKSNRLP